jgi:hypothetical protein
MNYGCLLKTNRRIKTMRNAKIKIALKTVAIAVLLMSVTAAPLANGIKKRIKFPRGASGVTMKGGVVRGERDEYLLKAGKGQWMKVKITSEEDNAVFQIYAPNGKTLKGAGEMNDATEWNGSLPLAGDYRVVVGGTRGNASYSLSGEIQ